MSRKATGIQNAHKLAVIQPRRRVLYHHRPLRESIVVSQVHVPLPDLSRFNQLLNSLASQDDLPDESLTIRADVVSPGTRSNVVFA